MKTKWEDTPFDSIEEAHRFAGKMGSKPSAIITDEKAVRYFQIKEGRKSILIAQMAGVGPVRERVIKVGAVPLQDPNIPRWGASDALLAFPWTFDKGRTLEDVRAHYEETFINPDNIETLDVVLYRIGGDEYEYVEDSSGVWSRVLHKKK